MNGNDLGGMRRKSWLLGLLLLAGTLAAYYPAWHGSLLWDDAGHITPVPLQSFHGLERIWFDLGATQQYYPLTHSFFWILNKFCNGNTLGYHLAGIFLHVISALLFAAILRRLAIPGAWLAAALFALHPIQVESVAWISELKNTLSGVFYLGAVLAYLKYDERRAKRHYIFALILFVLGLLSKTVTGVLPAVLLILLWWRHGRLRLREAGLPLVPFFFLGAAGGLFTAWIERTIIGARGPEFDLAWLERILIAGRAVWFYLAKLFLPVNLTFIYPRWEMDPAAWQQYLYGFALVVLLIVFWRMRKHSRTPLAVISIFCITLFPALGFINLFPFRYSFVADHFQYLAALPIFAVLGAAFSALAGHLGLRNGISVAVGVSLLGILPAALTWSQSRRYADAETLWQSTIRSNPSCWLAHAQLGSLLLANIDRTDEALSHLQEAVHIKPDYAENHYNLGNGLQKAGDFEAAEAEYREALRLKPDLAQAHNNLGISLQRMGRIEDATREYREALRLEPNLAEVHNNLALAFRNLSRFADALNEWRKALQINPDYLEAHYNLGVSLNGLGQFEEAIVEYREVLRLEPDLAVVHNSLGKALERVGRIEEAAVEYREALRLKPDFADARLNLNRSSAGVR
jgi:tetratricopeptide (TPR) repeat protein